MFDIAIGWYRVILAYELVLHWIGGVLFFFHSSVATVVRLVQVAQQLCFGVLDMFSMVGRVGFLGVISCCCCLGKLYKEVTACKMILLFTI